MAGTVPQEARALDAFANIVAPLWVERFAEIGITESQAEAILEQTPKLREAIQAAEMARNAAIAATQKMNNVARQLFEDAAVAVRTIRTHAIATDNVNVYTRAGLMAPKVRSRQAQPPAPPTDIAASILPGGAIALSWKTSQPRGVSNVTFEIYRSFNGNFDAMNLVGTAGGREFIDDTVPQGTRSVHYMLVPRRGSQEGASSAIFNLTLGSIAPAATASAQSQAATIGTRRAA